MKGAEEARRMLRMAERDLRLVEAVVGNAAVDDAVVGFHIQQVIEKSLKAWLAALGVDYPFVHDLGLLLDRLRREGQSVDSFRRLAAFSFYAVQMRYDDAIEGDADPGTLDRRQAHDEARSLFQHVGQVIQETEGPS